MVFFTAAGFFFAEGFGTVFGVGLDFTAGFWAVLAAGFCWVFLCPDFAVDATGLDFVSPNNPIFFM
jgi:hypothetical protein